MKGRLISMKSHLNCVESQFDMSGLSDGLYAEYATDVAIAFAYDLLSKLREDGALEITDKDLDDLLNVIKDVGND
jgi:hypothetical protein